MIEAGIIGGAGYTGLELLRLLLMHPQVKVSVVTSRRYRGRKISEVNPHLERFIELEYEDIDAREMADRSDVVFLAVPHGSAMDYVPDLLRAGTRVIDLSADYRLERTEYERVYRRQHKDHEPRKAVYGLTELHPEVADAFLVANPGCYPTGAVLAVAPLSDIADRIVFDAKSGISGAGAEPSVKSHYPNLAENIIPYEVTAHRHLAEMRKELPAVKVSFTPHVIPSIRGILTTAHVFLREGTMSVSELESLYRQYYDGKSFIRLRVSGVMPSLGAVRGTNFCDIGFEVEDGGDRIVIISAIDNLVKGGSGQAVQNMNLMFGLDEREGLWRPGLIP